uniref:patatin-like phospholipase family protein n=1 Tax=Alloprevotella sp. TaxID=1872471 RepID=UPI0040290DCA
TNSLLKGDKVIRTLKEMVPDTPIESLPIPFRAIAADLVTQREVVFSKGSIYRAIRSSISMPSILKPIKVAHHILIDGGIVNPLPLNRVVRAEGDILVSVNVSAPASEEIEERREAARLRQKGESRWLSLHRLMDTFTPDSVASNYMTLITSAIDLQIQRNTVLTQKITPPDVAVNIPMNRFGVFDFNHAEQITQVGYDEMNKALDAFESNL